jgi:hypothetical protein
MTNVCLAFKMTAMLLSQFSAGCACASFLALHETAADAITNCLKSSSCRDSFVIYNKIKLSFDEQ